MSMAGCRAGRAEEGGGGGWRGAGAGRCTITGPAHATARSFLQYRISPMCVRTTADTRHARPEKNSNQPAFATAATRNGARGSAGWRKLPGEVVPPTRAESGSGACTTSTTSPPPPHHLHSINLDVIYYTGTIHMGYIKSITKRPVVLTLTGTVT